MHLPAEPGEEKFVKCPTCQHEVSGRFCPNCGTDVQSVTGAGQPGAPDPSATAIMNPADLAPYLRSPQPPSNAPAGGPQQPPIGQAPFPQQAPPVDSPPGQPGAQPQYGAAPTPPPYFSAQTPYPQPQTPSVPQGQPQYAPPYGQPMTAVPVTRVRRGRRLLIAVFGVIGALIVIGIAAAVIVAKLGSSDSGKIKFGTSYKDTASTFSIQNEKTSFSPSDHVAWVGFLSHNVAPSSLRRTIALVKTNGTTRTIVDQPVKFVNSISGKVGQVAFEESIAKLEEVGISPPGKYRFSYLSNGKTEATGTMRLTGASPAGKVFFGTSSSDSMIAGVSQQSTFGPKDTMHYAAHFARPQPAGRLSVLLIRISSDGSEQTVSQGLHDDLTDPRTFVRLDRIAMSDLRSFGANSSGTYILRYTKGSSVLAEGKFTLKL